MPDRFVSNIPAFDVGNGSRTASVGVKLQKADLCARRSCGNDFHPHPAPCDTGFPSRTPGQRIIHHAVFIVSCLHTTLPQEINILRPAELLTQHRLILFHPLDSSRYRGLYARAETRSAPHSSQSFVQLCQCSLCCFVILPCIVVCLVPFRASVVQSCLFHIFNSSIKFHVLSPHSGGIRGFVRRSSSRTAKIP